MATFTLDDIRAAAEEKYGSTDIAVGTVVVRLLNPMRLSKEKRDRLFSLQSDEAGEDGEKKEESIDDQIEVMRQTLRLVAENEHQANTLLSAVGDDAALLATVFERYSTKQQLGEASASAG